MEPGDWVEGRPQWWWKYVLPSPEIFWANHLRDRVSQSAHVRVAGPQPDPWRGTLARLLEGVAMLDAAATVGDRAAQRRLQSEAIETIHEALAEVRQ